MFDKLLQLDVALRTDIGRKRPSNEDSMLSIIPSDAEVVARKGVLFVVADGMGGHDKGEVASQITVNTVSTVYYQDSSDDIAAVLTQAVKSANTSVYEQSVHKDDKSMTMGSTCIAAVVHGSTLYVANVGDSRAYIIRQGQAIRVSQDHSWVAEQIKAGLLTEEQAKDHERRNVITRCLGTQVDVEVDMFTEQVQDGDRLILCTDGLSSLVTDDELCAIVEQNEPEASVEKLIEQANERGGPDNVTAIVAHVGAH